MWTTRPETSNDVSAIRAVNLAAFPTPLEADLTEALRADRGGLVDGLPTVTENGIGEVVGYALPTRCHVGGEPTLAPCAVLPQHHGKGVGSAAIRTGLAAARAWARTSWSSSATPRTTRGSGSPRRPGSLSQLDAARPTPAGTIVHAAAFGV